MSEVGELPQQPNSAQEQNSEIRKKDLVEKTSDFFRRHPNTKLAAAVGVFAGPGAIGYITGQPLIATALYASELVPIMGYGAYRWIKDLSDPNRREAIEKDKKRPRISRGEYIAQLAREETVGNGNQNKPPDHK